MVLDNSSGCVSELGTKKLGRTQFANPGWQLNKVNLPLQIGAQENGYSPTESMQYKGRFDLYGTTLQSGKNPRQEQVKRKAIQVIKILLAVRDEG